MKSLLYISTIFLLGFSLSTHAQELLPRGVTPNGFISDMDRMGDVLYIGGLFDNVGYQTGGLAYLPGHSDIPDLNFPYIEGEIFDIEADGSGGWYIAGDFRKVGLLEQDFLAHINSDFSVDEDFVPEITNEIHALELKDNVLYVGGFFSDFDNSGKKYLIGYDLNSGSVTEFDPLPNHYIYDLEFYGDILIAGGAFSSLYGQTQIGLAKIDVANEQLLEFPEVSAGGRVFDFLIDGDSLYAGGAFLKGLIGVSLVSDSVLSWDPSVGGFGFSMRVNALEKRDTVIYFGGNFNSLNGQDRSNVAAVGLSGEELPFNPLANNEVFGLRIHNDSLYVGGKFEEIGGLPHAFCAKLDLVDGNPSDWDLELDWAANEIFLNDDDLLLGGGFEVIHPVARDNAYAVDLNTGELTDWNPITEFLSVIDVHADPLRDAIFLAGHATVFGEYLKVFDSDFGAEDVSWYHTFDKVINKIDEDLVTGNIYVGGDFNSVDGESREHIAGFDANGNLLPFSLQIDNEVENLAVASDYNSLYFAGEFDTVAGEFRKQIASVSLDGDLRDWAPDIQEGVNNNFLRLQQIVPKGDTIFLVGQFEFVNGLERNGLAAVHPINGDTYDWDPNPEASRIEVFVPDDRGAIVASNTLTAIGGAPVNNVAYVDLNSAMPLAKVPEIGLSAGDISQIVPFDSLLWIAGSFNFLDGKRHEGLATIGFDFEFEIPNLSERIARVFPPFGSNNGDVTISITGVGFEEGTSVSLTKERLSTIEAKRDLTFIYDEERISATFNLTDAPLGSRNIEIEIPDDTTLILEDAFTVVEGTDDLLTWAEVIHPEFVTANSPEQFYLAVGNRGNSDAIGVPVWMALSPNVNVLETSIDYIEVFDESDTVDDDIQHFIPISNLLGEPYDANLYSLVLPRVEANSTKIIPFTIIGYQTDTFCTRAWTHEMIFRDTLKSYPANCIDAAIENILGSSPDADCSYNVLDNATSQILDFIFDPDVGTAYAYNFNELVGQVSFVCAEDENVPANLADFSEDVVEEFVGAESSLLPDEICFVPDDKEDKKGVFVASVDPNDKTGIQGRGEGNWLNSLQRFPFMIRFENDEDATAPAKKVVIEDALDLFAFDFNSLELRGFAIADSFYTIPPGYSEYTHLVDLRPRLPYLVKCAVELDEGTGVLTWELTTRDPATLEEVTDPLGGFLPPNVDSLSGEGAVLFDINLKNNLSPGYHLTNSAAIYFDFNDPIITNVWSINLDTRLPESSVDELPEISNEEEITVSWSGTDEGAGVRYYDVYFRKDEGAWEVLSINTLDTSKTMAVEYESSYDFYSIAHDSAFNIEPAPVDPDATIRIVKITAVDDEHENQGLTIYPNPTSTFINIRFEQQVEATEFSIVDISGNTVDKWLWEGGISTYKWLPSLPPGMYFLNWQNQAMNGHRKLIIK